MGQKAHPYGLRVGYIKPWRARWFTKNDAVAYLGEDLKIRKYLKAKLASAGVSSVEIDRASSRLRVRIFAAKPGVIIGRRGQEIDKIKEDLAEITKSEVFLDIKEVKMPQIDAQLVAENMALQLEKRVSFRRAMKKAVQLAMQKGALGIKVKCKGRLGGAEIAREEGYKEGKVPLSTFRADIDYGFAEAFTTYGTIGCKAWIYKGDVLVKKELEEQKQELEKKLRQVEAEMLKKAEAVNTEKPEAQENTNDAPNA
ncbi:MAG: 30S ribosomal protein S3 [Candidatus Omnitrophica bacterium ADurb.Bin277]|nr:MAG: 30S ribosomal protein S3 [Candidatus Omnitrophica bacterium ADurb.Bin277]